jgi:hypothetical protein
MALISVRVALVAVGSLAGAAEDSPVSREGGRRAM